MLLFNQSVEKIELYHLDKNDVSKQVLLFTTSKQVLRTTCDIPITHSILKEASEMKKRDILGTQQLNVLQEVSVEVKTKADKGAALFHTEPKTVKCKWLVSWSTGNKPQSLEIAKREKGALLLGAVAVPVQSNGKSTAIISFDKIPNHFYQKGHYYFFLPLPIEHGLPFHINGQFAVTPDRQALRTSSEGDRNMTMKEWNECLIEDAVTKSLLHLLMKLPKLVDLSRYHYQQLWPTKTDYMLKYLCQSFYQHVVHQERYAVFEKDGHWFDISKCLFIEREFRQSYAGEIAFKAFNVLTLPSDAFVVDVRDDIYDFMLSAGTELITDKTVSAVTFFTEYFIPQLDKFDTGNMQKERNRLIKYAIDLDDSLINELLTKEACIPTQPRGSLKRPCQLVDETSKLSKLFSTSDEYFPLKMFSETPTTKYLHKLGLVYEQLTNDMVLFAASSVEQIQSKGAFERSSALLDYLGETELHIHRDTFEELQHIKFVPVSSKPELWPFKWKSDSIIEEHHPKKKCKKHRQLGPKSIMFYQTKDLYCWELRNLVGCVSLVLHEKICIKNTELLNVLGVLSVCDLMTVLSQLLLMSETCAGKDNDKYFNDIYRFLDKECTYEQSELINSKLQNKNIVWVDGLLTYPEKVAENIYRDCNPHLYSLERSPLKHYSALRECLGIQKRFSAEKFAKTLHNIKESFGEHPVQSSDIQTILNLLQCFKMASGHKTFEGVVYGPDENCILRDCKTMCFNDFDELEKSETMNYSHPEMSISLAKALGVKPKLLHSIEENSEDFEDFYQDEPLLTRIQNLIEGYPCDIGIFKELLQNADDAKASQMHFLLDYDTHPDDNVFHKKYGALQGPALCVFNNSAFSEKDLSAIKMLGRGNKSDDMFKTGRYGVGFNAVYNLTDVPSFLTWGGDIENNETLCFFDPMACYIPSINKLRPGKRYKSVAPIRNHSNDVLKGFHENYFKKITGQTGTIFRLPLRRRALAKESEIKKEPIEVDMVSKMLDKFCIELKNVILFLKHLNMVKITVHLNGDYIDQFTIGRHMNKTQSKRYSDLIQTQKNFSKSVADSSQYMLTFPFHSEVCEMTLKETLLTSEGRSHTHNAYIVLHTTGFKYPKDIPTLLCETINGKNIGLLPSGAVAIRKETKITENEQCLAYCFLPLPIPTGLPVHVHGYFALDNETRRTLWKSEDEKTCHKSLWNSVLLEQVIAPAYSLLIDYIRKSMIEPQTNRRCKYASVSEHLKYYLSVLPTDNLASDFYWKHLTKFVYKELVRDCVPFLPILKTSSKPYLTGNEDFGILSWAPLQIEGHKFPAYRNDAELFSKKNNFFRDLELLESIKLRSVTISDEIQHSMDIAKCAIESLLPLHMINYLTSFNSDHVDRCDIKIDTDVAKTIIRNNRNVLDLLKFCMRDHEAFCNDLMNIPLFLTMDGVLRTLPENSYVFVETVARFCCFFPSAKKKFLNSEVANLLNHGIKAYTEISNGVLKPFTLQRFMELVAETKVIQCDQSIVLWDTKSISSNWIKNFWCFFYTTFERKQYAEREDYTCSTSSELRESVSQHLGMIKTLPVIPVFETVYFQSKSLHLVNPGYVQNLIDLESFSSMSFLREAMGDINLLQLHTEMLPDPYHASNALSLQELLMSVLPDFSHPEEILTCLHLNIEKVRNCSLSARKSTTILKYFAESAYASLLKADMIRRLRDLPLFQSHFEDIVSLSQYSSICVAPWNMPLDGLKELAITSRILFLKDIGLDDFYTNLNINMKSLADIYVGYIIPNHSQMEITAFYKHIIFLANNGFKEDCNILNVLKVTPFINVTSRSVLVRDLFDPDVELFSHMCTENELVPLELRERYTLQMLRNIDLQTTLTIPLIERFANAIQADRQQESQDVSARNSVLLLRLLFNMPEAFFVQNEFYSIKKIQFVRPLNVDNELQAIHPQYNPQIYICLDGSVLSSEMLSCWTSSNLLPESVDINRHWKSFKTIVDKLGIREKPTFEQLLIHCKQIGKSSKNKSKPFIHNRLPSVMHNIYNCLEHYTQSGDINKADFLKLCDVPIIYHKEIKDTFTARQTVISCKDEEEEIRPLINKCPPKYAEHHEIFVLLGCWKDTCCDMYASVLFALRNHVDGSGLLLPKPQADAVKALGLMFKHLCQLTTETEVEEQNQYLLSENMTLRKARTLVINDTRYFSDAIRKDKSIRCTFLYSFDKLNEFHLRTDFCIDCLKYLPENTRPHLLTNLAKRKVILDNIEVKEKGPANLLNEFVHGREFIHGYSRLVRHVLKKTTLNTDIQHWSNSVETKIADTVQNITFKHVTGIETMLFFKCVEDENAGKEMAVENSKDAGLVHLERKDDTAILYFDTSNPVWFDKVKMEIALFLNELADGKLHANYFVLLMELINLKDDPCRIPMHLSQNSIEEYQSTVEIDENPIYPVAGTFVPRKLHKYLDNDFGIFQSYEYKYVALEVDDPALADSDDVDEDQEESRNMEPTYIFVHIISKSDVVNNFPLLQEYVIDDGSETPYTVQAYRLYKFMCKRDNTANMQVVLHERQPSGENRTSTTSHDLNEARKEIREYLIVAWKQPEPKGRKLVIRLLRKWHPDKNPDNVQFCTKVFQYIQQCLRRLEKGQALLDDDNETNSSYWESSWYGRYWSRYRRHREDFDEFDGFAESSYHGSPRFTFSYQNQEPYRWISEARRWFKQAVSDQDNARTALENGITSNWVCYMSHQAGEKSLKAAWYAKDANKIHGVKYSHNLTAIASGLSSTLVSMAQTLCSLTGEHTRMRYPDTMCGQDIPAKAYTRRTAIAVISKVQEIQDFVKQHYGLK